jgi:hypothetical protein
MDEAFRSIEDLIVGLIAFEPLVDEDAGVRTYIRRCEIESPVELDITATADGVRLGSTPPLYYVDTSLRPSYHRLSITAELARPAFWQRTDG